MQKSVKNNEKKSHIIVQKKVAKIVKKKSAD